MSTPRRLGGQPAIPRIVISIVWPASGLSWAPAAGDWAPAAGERYALMRPASAVALRPSAIPCTMSWRRLSFPSAAAFTSAACSLDRSFGVTRGLLSRAHSARRWRSRGAAEIGGIGVDGVPLGERRTRTQDQARIWRTARAQSMRAVKITNDLPLLPA